MSRPVNLLPWRQNRRRCVLRFWGLMFSALPLLAAALYGRQQAEQIHTQALPHWDGVTPGATRRDARGRWQFSYRLQRTDREPASG
ncbi:hypothetical protein QDZ17_001944 [Pluralibacter gergoviae]|nr:hypothetical protein [Pluralibacter gergoviae]